MAAPDHTAQFQEPPVSPLPTQSAPKPSDISAQFQEPMSPPVSNDVSDGSKLTTNKKPLDKGDDVKSPELEAAEEVLQDKGLV
ncbi:hypothetical protein NX059_003339 [Plenodomus lindquistii]|nr:hypothetical protein NX059_003339 [Plenodomus lindquistii]